jgi:hypothetical protein
MSGENIAFGPLSQLLEHVIPAKARIWNLNLATNIVHEVIKNEPIFEQVDIDRSVANPKTQRIAIFITG